MKFAEIAALVVACAHPCQQTTLLLGPPGIGKTAIGYEIASLLKAKLGRTDDPVVEVLDLTSRLPEDLGGLPYREGEAAKYAAQDWALRCAQPGAYGVLVLDDLPAASPAVAAATRQLVLDRRLHNVRLSDDIVILVTGNRRQDKAGASQLPSHFNNAVLMLEFQPDLQEWCEWYYGGGQTTRSLLVPAFLQFRQSFFSMTPDTAATHGSFATPRSWAKLGAMLGVLERAGALDKGTVFALGNGLVGNPATELAAFYATKNAMKSGAELMADPERALPAATRDKCKPDERLAMIASIAEEASTRYHKGVKEGSNTAAEKALTDGLRAMVWVCGKGQEYIGMGTNMLQGLGISPARWAAMLKNNERAPWCQDIRAFTAAARSGR